MTGETVYVDGVLAVSNVLVHNGEASTFNTMHAIDINNFVGPYADYILYFPIDFQGDLTGRKITVRGIECDVLGHPDHERPRQVFGSWLGNWDMTVRVKKTLAAEAEYISIVATEVTRNALGSRETKEVILYAGNAQARQNNATESTDSDTGTTSTLNYIFVINWLDSLAKYQTQQLKVIYKNKEFDVVSIENKDEKNTTAILRGVWNG